MHTETFQFPTGEAPVRYANGREICTLTWFSRSAKISACRPVQNIVKGLAIARVDDQRSFINYKFVLYYYHNYYCFQITWKYGINYYWINSTKCTELNWGIHFGYSKVPWEQTSQQCNLWYSTDHRQLNINSCVLAKAPRVRTLPVSRSQARTCNLSLHTHVATWTLHFEPVIPIRARLPNTVFPRIKAALD